MAAVCGALLAAAVVLLMLNQATFILAVGLAVIYPPLTFIMQYIRINKTVGKNPNFTKTVNNYEFDFSCDYMVLTIKQGKREERHEIPYSEICKAYETKTNFYIYLNQLSALIIKKEDIDGDARELAGILNYYMGRKFHSGNNAAALLPPADDESGQEEQIQGNGD